MDQKTYESLNLGDVIRRINGREDGVIIHGRLLSGIPYGIVTMLATNWQEWSCYGISRPDILRVVGVGSKLLHTRMGKRFRVSHISPEGAVLSRLVLVIRPQQWDLVSKSQTVQKAEPSWATKIEEGWIHLQHPHHIRRDEVLEKLNAFRARQKEVWGDIIPIKDFFKEFNDWIIRTFSFETPKYLPESCGKCGWASHCKSAELEVGRRYPEYLRCTNPKADAVRIRARIDTKIPRRADFCPLDRE